MKRNKFIFAFLLSFISLVSFAQKECEVVKDPFTGEVRKTFYYGAEAFPRIQFELKKDGFALLTIRIDDKGVINVKIPKGSELLLKLENGESITLLTNKEVIGNSGAYSAGGSGTTYTEVYLPYLLNPEQLEKLINLRVTHMKIINVRSELEIKDLTKVAMQKTLSKMLQKGAICVGTKN